MSVPVLLLLLGAVLVLVDELRSEGVNLTGWAVFLVIVALLWGKLA